MAKIQIAYLIDTISSSKAGTEKQILNIIERLDSNMFDITLFCLHDSPWLVSNRLPCEVIVLGYKGFLKPGFPLVLRKYLSLVKEKRLDIVQTFFEDSMFVAFLAKVFTDTRHMLIVSRRDLGLGSDEPSYHWLFKKIKPFMFRCFVHSIATNAHAIKKIIVKQEKVPAENIIVIGNGIDQPAPPHQLPTLFREFPATTWIAIVANLKPVKRIDLLVQAVAYFKESRPNEVIRVIALGDGRLKSELIQLATELGVGDRIHFLGSVENVNDYLYGVDIGVLCSDNEGLSNAILEYMACGLPVIATNAGGNNELVDDTNGACVPTGDYLALAQALARLIDSPDARKQMGYRSLEKVRQNYTWGKVILQWERYYGSCVDFPVLSDKRGWEEQC